MTSEGSADWYQETASLIAVVFVCSVISFLVVFTVIWAYVRSQFSAQAADKLQTLDSPELVVVKAHTRAVRLLSLLGVVLQAALIIRLTNTHDTADDRPSEAYTFSLFRPVLNLCIYFLGFMTNTHPFFRLLFVACLLMMIVIDTVAEVNTAMLVNCLETQQLRCGKAPAWLDLGDLEFMRTRDLLCLSLNPWLLLEVGYLSLTVGICSSRYTRRHLSLSRPRFNVRAALAHYFPTPVRAVRPQDSKKWSA